MIRTATPQDIPSIVAMTGRLHAAARMVLPIDTTVTARFLSGLIAAPLGLVLVVDAGQGPAGFIAASIGTASIAMLPIAIEHGWWAGGGGGLELLRRYEAWAQEQGCFAARMSTPPDNERAARILERRGYSISELAWAKVL